MLLPPEEKQQFFKTVQEEGFATYPFRTDDWPWKTPKD